MGKSKQQSWKKFKVLVKIQMKCHTYFETELFCGFEYIVLVLTLSYDLLIINKGFL